MTIQDAASPAASQTPARRPRREPLGRLRKPLLELALLLGALLALDLLAFGGTRFEGVRPHPFGAVVLLLAVQYGTGAGMAAAAASTAALFVGNLPVQALGEDLNDHMLRLFAEPILWLAAALVLGELSDRSRRKAARLARDLEASLARERDLAGAYTRLRAAKEDLEIRVAGQMKTVLTIYRAARAIERLSFGEVLMGVADLVREVIGPTKFSLFLLNQNTLEAALNEGWSQGDRFARVFDQDSALFQAMVGGQRVLSVSRPADQRILGGEGILAGPLVSSETGEVVGMLKIEGLDLLQLNLAGIENFRLLCEWVGTAFAKAQRYEAAQDATIRSLDGKLLSDGLLERDRALLTAIARRIGFPLSMVTVSVADEDRADGIEEALAAAAREVLRETDNVFDARRAQGGFVVLLPGAGPEAATSVAERLRAAIARNLGPRAADTFSTGASVLHPGGRA